MMVATHPKIYWATVHPMVVMGINLGKIRYMSGLVSQSVAMTHLPTYYQSHGKARAIQAAVGLKQLSRIEELNSARIVNGAYLDAKLDTVSSLGVPEYPEGSEPIYMSFVVHHRDRQEVSRSIAF